MAVSHQTFWHQKQPKGDKSYNEGWTADQRDIDVPGCWGTAEYTADIVTAAIGEGVHTSPEFTRNLRGKKSQSSQTMGPWLPKTKTQNNEKLLYTHYLGDTKKKKNE